MIITQLPYSTLSANSTKHMFTFEPVKTTQNSPLNISEGGRIWQVGIIINIAITLIIVIIINN